MERMKPILDRIPPAWGKWLPEPGWDDLLLEVNRELAVLDPGYEINQVKEKFGGLRYYFTCSEELYNTDEGSTVREEMHRIAGEAEEKSATICEYCGRPGKSRSGGWIKTLCDEHAAGEGKDDNGATNSGPEDRGA
jgi:hypothetical protein